MKGEGKLLWGRGEGYLYNGPSFLGLETYCLASVALTTFSLSSNMHFNDSVIGAPSFAFTSVLSLSASSNEVGIY